MLDLIECYDEYVQLVGESEASMIGLAYAHGYRGNEQMAKRGAELRAKINELKHKYGIPVTAEVD